MNIIEKIRTIAKLIDEQDDLEMFEKCLLNIDEYVHVSYKMVVHMELAAASGGFDRAMCEEFTELDHSKRNCHNGAISSVSWINNISAALGGPVFYEGNLEDRVAVGDFCEEVVDAVFEDRTTFSYAKAHEIVEEARNS